jgi:hypothetical protein
MAPGFDRLATCVLEPVRQRSRIGEGPERFRRGLYGTPRILARLFQALDLGFEARELRCTFGHRPRG